MRLIDALRRLLGRRRDRRERELIEFAFTPRIEQDMQEVIRKRR